jgi:hypothetical protein
LPYVDVGDGGLHGVGGEAQAFDVLGLQDFVRAVVGLVVHLEAVNVEILRQVERLCVEVLPLLPAVGPAGGCTGRIERIALAGAVHLDHRLDAHAVQLAECIGEVDVVAARGGDVLVAVLEVGPVDVGRVGRIRAERSAAGDELGF